MKKNGALRLRFFIKSISGILFLVSKVIVISLGLSLPKDSSNLPSRLGRAALSVGIFGLAARKVYPEAVSPRLRVSSYLTFSPLLRRAVIFCGTCCYLKDTFLLRSTVLCAVPTFLTQNCFCLRQSLFRAAKIHKNSEPRTLNQELFSIPNS